MNQRCLPPTAQTILPPAPNRQPQTNHSRHGGLPWRLAVGRWISDVCHRPTLPALAFALFTLLLNLAATAGEITPRPAKLETGRGHFPLPPGARPMELLRSERQPGLGAEAYRLEITPERALLVAGGPAGEFYGRQTARQWILSNRWPSVVVEDAPRFGWRGFMLDESRHFFGKAAVKQLLDEMARLKLNRFHWHLTDEPGWRVEIKKYPRLTETGAVGNWSDAKAPRAFYTQDDIREIVAYAAARHIVVIPEIDMPGHATAATRAYPELSGGGTGRWKGFTFHPARERTYEFIQDVLTEVAELFPGPWLHIGADEVSYGNQSWKTDPEMQQFIRENNLKDELGLEHFFVRRVQGIVHRLGKTMVGWDEIVEAGLPADQCVVMWWRHDKPEVLERALQQGFQVVLCPRRPLYFDFVQHESHRIGRRWNGFNPVPDVLAFPEPVAARIQGRESQVLGMQACLWTETVADVRQLHFLTFPRLAALAEAAWTPATAKQWDDFESRLPGYLQELRERKVYIFDPFNPAATPEPRGPVKQDVLADG